MHPSEALYRGCNVGDLVASAVARGGDRVAFISDDLRWTYKELGAKISQVVQAWPPVGCSVGTGGPPCRPIGPKPF